MCFLSKKSLQFLGLFFFFIILLLQFSCSKPGQSVANKSQKSEVIMGAGATFPYPLYSKMFYAYHELSQQRVNYQSIGSGGGVRQLMKKTVDFGATDAFITDKKMKTFDAPIVHIPICLGAVAVTYNLPALKGKSIRLTPATLAAIYLGDIKYWNDAAIALDNPDVQLPKLKITPVYRSDGSGTTAIFTDYLSKISTAWKSKVGFGKSVNWPLGIGAKGNSGVAGILKQMPGGIAYLNLAYCVQNNLSTVALKNKSGFFVLPTIESTTLAAASKMPVDTRVSITDSTHQASYPISGFTWIIAYQNQAYANRSAEDAAQLKALLNWMVTDAQPFAAPLYYSPLPKNVVSLAQDIIANIKY
eukprot:COSAG01_NODE_412_length_17370_cov_26.910196_10_plen_359_part_00